jgi:drug/metabolite transporter (DMT)-like permease
MVAFAANSLLCRLALAEQLIDPTSFASIRLVSGALLLSFLLRGRSAQAPRAPIDWTAVSSLLAYAVFFTWAYVELAAGTGALILFGMVQLTMFAVGLYGGERFSMLSWAGFAIAVIGLAYLLSPGSSAPPVLGAAWMAVAGIAWGTYSLRGRNSGDALRATSRNFVLAVPFIVALHVALASQARLSPYGMLLALASGMLTSGLGYVAWYAVLPRLRALSAATVQLSVPAITAFGGVLLLSEPLSARLAIASVAILGGIALALTRRNRAH